MIKPYGAESLNPLFIYDTEQHHALIQEAESLPSLLLNSAAAANAVMLGAGYFTPLTGFMHLTDVLSVAHNWHTNSGLFWPIPIFNITADTHNIGHAKRIALRDPNVEGHPVLAIMNIDAIEDISDQQRQLISSAIFGTRDPNHPGVALFNNLGNKLLSGPIEVLNFSYFQTDFPDTFRTAVDIRHEIIDRGWNTVVAFQTRNPMHRAHEALCRMAMRDLQADGVLIHMLLGKLKAGDIPATVRDQCIRTMVQHYFPPNTVMITGYGFDMLYAGPREAVLHALFRQNCGCTHFIVGRDHAGVGDYYGAFDAQTVFDSEAVRGQLAIEIYRADHTAYSKKLHQVIMMRDAPDHTKEDFVLISGTKLRHMLSEGIAPPPEFTRPECASILMDYYQKIKH